MLRLLSLPDDIKLLVENHSLSAATARALLFVADPQALAREAVRSGMSVREIEAAAHRMLGDAGAAKPAAKRGAAIPTSPRSRKNWASSSA